MSPDGSIAEIDHIAFGATRLASACDGLARLGFSLTRGSCTWSAAAGSLSAGSASVMFDHDYLDVIEHHEARWRAHVDSSPLYGRGLAPSGIVLRAGSVEAVAQRLERAQIAYLPPYDIERRLEDSLDPFIRYRLLPLDRRAAGGLPLAFVHDPDPGVMRTPASLSHANAAIGLARVTLHVTDPGGARRAFETVVDAAGSRAAAASAGARPSVDFINDANDDYLRAIAALLRVSDRAALLALTFWSALDQTTQVLAHHGVKWLRLGPGRIGVDPGEGIGCGMVFENRSAR